MTDIISKHNKKILKDANKNRSWQQWHTMLSSYLWFLIHLLSSIFSLSPAMSGLNFYAVVFLSEFSGLHCISEDISFVWKKLAKICKSRRWKSPIIGRKVLGTEIWYFMITFLLKRSSSCSSKGEWQLGENFRLWHFLCRIIFCTPPRCNWNRSNFKI